MMDTNKVSNLFKWLKLFLCVADIYRVRFNFNLVTRLSCKGSYPNDYVYMHIS